MSLAFVCKLDITKDQTNTNIHNQAFTHCSLINKNVLYMQMQTQAYVYCLMREIHEPFCSKSHFHSYFTFDSCGNMAVRRYGCSRVCDLSSDTQCSQQGTEALYGASSMYQPLTDN